MLYGCRLVFLLGGALALIIFYMRKTLAETDDFLQAQQHHAVPFIALYGATTSQKKTLNNFLPPLMQH